MEVIGVWVGKRNWWDLERVFGDMDGKKGGLDGGEGEIFLRCVRVGGLGEWWMGIDFGMEMRE
jgi:hypothetical protein